MNNLVLSSSTLIGTDVKNPQGENLGNVKDVMIDIESGRVAYLVLSFGGFLGIGDKYFAIPLESFKVDSVDDKLMLNVEKERLKDAPGFDKDNWPLHAQSDFLDEVYSYYGYGSFLKDKVNTYADSDYAENRGNSSMREGSNFNADKNLRNEYGDKTNENFNRNDIGNVNNDTNRRRDLDPDGNRSTFNDL